MRSDFRRKRSIVRRMNYAGVARLLGDVAPDGADVVLADLGLSSMQIDDPARGFTFKVDGPLDMRMDPTRGRTASDLLSMVDETGLARILAENSDEPDAFELASAILLAHAADRLRQPDLSPRSCKRQLFAGPVTQLARKTMRCDASSRRCESRSTTNWGRSRHCFGACHPASSREAESPSSRSIRARTGG